MDCSIRVISDPICRSPFRLMIPAMPHIYGSTSRYSSRSQSVTAAR